jgi:hypothetical protein
MRNYEYDRKSQNSTSSTASPSSHPEPSPLASQPPTHVTRLLGPPFHPILTSPPQHAPPPPPATALLQIASDRNGHYREPTPTLTLPPVLPPSNRVYAPSPFSRGVAWRGVVVLTFLLGRASSRVRLGNGGWLLPVDLQQKIQVCVLFFYGRGVGLWDGMVCSHRVEVDLPLPHRSGIQGLVRYCIQTMNPVPIQLPKCFSPLTEILDDTRIQSCFSSVRNH